MKVLALGGCGGMGRYAVRTALEFDFVEEVVVADRDGDAASRFAHECGPVVRAATARARVRPGGSEIEDRIDFAGESFL